MSKIIGIVSGKGGAGKTTLCANLAFALAAEGKNVIAIDGDIGLKNLDILLGMTDGSAFDITDILAGRCTVSKAIQTHSEFPSLSFISASQSLKTDKINKDDFRRLCRYLRNFYDYVLIDAPAGVGETFMTIAFCCDECLVVATPDLTSIRDAEKTTSILSNVPGLITKLVINKINSKLINKGRLKNIDDIMDSISLPLAGLVPIDNDIILFSNSGKPIIGTKSVCAEPVLNIAKRLMGEDAPLAKIWRK